MKLWNGVDVSLKIPAELSNVELVDMCTVTPRDAAAVGKVLMHTQM